MTTPSTTNESTPQKSSERRREAAVPSADASPDRLDELAKGQAELTQQARELAARQLADDGMNGDDGARAERLLAAARAELLQQLLREQQEQARQQLAEAARSGEDAVAGVVRSVTTIVQSIVPPALVRPEDLIEATFSLADQGLRIGRKLALSVTENARPLLPLG